MGELSYLLLLSTDDLFMLVLFYVDLDLQIILNRWIQSRSLSICGPFNSVPMDDIINLILLSPGHTIIFIRSCNSKKNVNAIKHNGTPNLNELYVFLAVN